MILNNFKIEKLAESPTILFVDEFLLSYVFNSKKENINKIIGFLNKKRFRVGDTGLTYRQINTMGGNGLLDDNRDGESEWRMFSLKELVYLLVIKELRKYGSIDRNLKKLRGAFFSSKLSFESDMALIYIMYGEQMILVVDDDFSVSIYSSSEFLKSRGRSVSFISINLNEIYKVVWNKIGSDKLDYKTEYEKIVEKLISNAENVGTQLSDKEFRILEFIRNSAYKVITVRKNNNSDNLLVKCERVEEINEKELSDIIKNDKFVDVSIIKKDGNIVNVKVENTFKI